MTTVSNQRSSGTRSKYTTRFSSPSAAADGFDQFRYPQREGHRFALPERRRQRPRALVQRQHPSVTIERHHRVGQAGDDGPKKIVAAFGSGDALDHAGRVLAGANSQNGGRGHDSKARSRIERRKRAGEPQHAENQQGRNNNQTPAAPAISV
jgi:hypothetical protein